MYRKSCAQNLLAGSDWKVECGYHSVCHASTMSRPRIHCVEMQCLIISVIITNSVRADQEC